MPRALLITTRTTQPNSHHSPFHISLQTLFYLSRTSPKEPFVNFQVSPELAFQSWFHHSNTHAIERRKLKDKFLGIFSIKRAGDQSTIIIIYISFHFQFDRRSLSFLFNNSDSASQELFSSDSLSALEYFSSQQLQPMWGLYSSYSLYLSTQK